MKKVILLIPIVILIFLSIVYYYSIKCNELVVVEDSLVMEQSEIEKKFESNGYTIDNPNVILNPYEISPLTALVIFETDEKVKPTVIINGKDENTTFTNTFESNTVHYLPIYGLYPDYNNEIIIKYGDISKTIYIKTDKLPDDFILPTNVVSNKSKLDNELYFFSPSSKGYVCAYDVNGDVRWYLTESFTWNINRLENGNLLVASDNFVDGTVEDYIVELDRNTGDIVKTFNLKDILNVNDGKSENWTDYDWFHNNSVWYDKNTNSITLSGRHQDAVINIDYDSGKLNWIIGDSTNWSSEYQQYFFKPIGDFEWQWSQHAAMITPEGYVFIFDNGNNKSKIKDEYVPATDSYSRGVMYKIDTTNMTIEQVWQYGKERGSSYYSPYISDVDYIDTNHYIVHSGGISYKDGVVQNQPAGLVGSDTLKSITTELLNNEVIFEIELPTNNYRVEKMPLYSDNYELKDAEVLGGLGQTEVDKSLALIFNAKEINDEYKTHNVTFTKQSDRLVVNGTFKKGTDVEIILYQNLVAYKYEWRISKTPYTAMCVDIFNEKEDESGLNTNKYINSKGLKGRYNIFIKIDDKLYKTNNYVEF